MINGSMTTASCVMKSPGHGPRYLPLFQRAHVNTGRLSARERKWETESGKAEFHVPDMLEEDPDMLELETRVPCV